MLKTIIRSLGALLLSSATVMADEAMFDTKGAYQGAYICIEEAAAGIAYNPTLQKWMATNFRPDEKKLLVKLAPIQVKPVFSYLDDKGMEYAITISEFGSNDQRFCVGSPSVFVNSGGYMTCTEFAKTYQFNFTTGRFIYYYEHGYVSDDKNTNSDTPAVSIGTCAKL